MKQLFTVLALAAPLTAAASGFGPTRPGVGVSAAATDQPFAVGTNAVNVGVGFGNRYATVFSGAGGSSTPALSLSYERGVTEISGFVLGVGLFVGYQGSSYESKVSGAAYKQTTTDLIVNLRGAMHYPVSEKLDAYAGLGIGYRNLSFKSEPSTALDLSVTGSSGLQLFAGARYFFTPSLGAFAELGYDQTYAKIGLALKF